MSPSLSPAAEARRIAELHSFAILDTPREIAFDRLVRRAAEAVGAPVALVSLVDRDRQWFKARIGIDITETPRDVAFCRYPVAAGEPLVVRDATDDPRFADNPLVMGEPGIRFYAGVPLVTPRGHVVGTLCVIDFKPREIGPRELRALRRIADAVTGQIAMRSAVREINAAFANPTPRVKPVLAPPVERALAASPAL